MLSKYIKYRRAGLIIEFSTLIAFLTFGLIGHQRGILLAIPSAVFFLVWLIVSVIDFLKFVKKHDLLNDAAAAFELELPEPSDVFDEDYHLIISQLQKQLEDSSASCEEQKKDILQFFLLWTENSSKQIVALSSDPQLASLKNAHDIELCRQYTYSMLDFYNYKNECCSVDEIVREIVVRYNPVFFSKKVGIGIKRIGLSVFSDRDALTAVIDELIVTALIKTEKGGVRIYSDKGEKQALIIEDTSPGINPLDLAKIFERGSNISMYALKHITDALNIKIDVESLEGRGFAVRLEFAE